MTTVSPGKVVAVLVFIGSALCSYFVLPSNAVIFGDAAAQQRAGILIGALLLVFNAVQNQLPRVQDAPQRPAKGQEAE